MTDLTTFLKTLNVTQVVGNLQAAPDDLAGALTTIDLGRQNVNATEESLRLAEANAEAAAWMALAGDGRKMLADEKKAAVTVHIAADPEATSARLELANAKLALGQATAQFEAAKARFAAARSLSDLAAATLNYVSHRRSP